MATMKALVTISGKSAAVKEIPIPQPGKGEILVKVKSVAQNPTDWKAMQAVPEGRIIGCDFSGTIEDSNGSSWTKGQRVAGFVHGTRDDPIRGSFAEYLVTEHDAVYAVPDSINNEDAATIPLAFATASQALFQRLALPDHLHPVSSTASTPTWVLIYGGSSSVGKYAIQLCKLSGLKVITTASPRNHALLTSLGADVCVDYSTPSWPEEVRKQTQDGLMHAFDCISEHGSTKKIAQSLSASRGGHIVTLLPTKPEDDGRTTVGAGAGTGAGTGAGAASTSGQGEQGRTVKVESTIVYTVFGRALTYGTFDNCGTDGTHDYDGDKAHLTTLLSSILPSLLETRRVVPNRVQVRDGGLDGITRGFKDHMAGSVSAQKLCYVVSS